MGAVLAQDRPGVREIRIRYGGGYFYNSTPRRIRRRLRPWRHRARPSPVSGGREVGGCAVS